MHGCWDYGPLDRVVTVGPESATLGVFDSAAAFEYRDPYLQAGKQLGNGLASVRQFDPARRMLDETAHNAGGRLVFQERLGWSPRNLKTHQARLDQSRSTSTFGYDGAGRVTIRSGESLVPVPANNTTASPEAFQVVRDGEAYGLDTAQKLVTRQSVRDGVAGPVVPLTPDSSGRNRPGTLDGTPLTYDANGNLTAKGDLRFEYDFRNRLTRVLGSGGQELAANEYDAFNRRVSRSVAGSRTDYVWSGWQVVEEYRDGSLSRRRLFGSGLDEIVFEQGDVDGDGTLETSYYPLYDSIGNLVALTGDDGTAFERYSYTPFGREQRITVDALPPAIRQLLLRGNEIRVDLTEEVVPEEVLDAVADGRIRVEDVSTGTPLDLDVRFPSIPAPTPPQSTTGDLGQTSAASVSRISAPALTGSGVLTTALDYQSDQQARRFALVLTTPPSAGTELRLVIAADALRDPFGNAASAGADQTFPWSTTDVVLADTEPPAVQAVRVRQGYLEVEFDEEVDLATVPNGVTVTPTGGTALTLNWSSLGDGFTVRTDETLPAGTFDLDIATTVQDLAGATLATAYGQQFDVVNVGADLELFEAPDERIIPTSSVGNIHGFHGLPMDPETGLIYVRNRYYDPELGRFITADPLGYVDGPSMYGAFLNDPVNRADPMGLDVDGEGVVWWNPFTWFNRSDQDSAKARKVVPIQQVYRPIYVRVDPIKISNAWNDEEIQEQLEKAQEIFREQTGVNIYWWQIKEELDRGQTLDESEARSLIYTGNPISGEGLPVWFIQNFSEKRIGGYSVAPSYEGDIYAIGSIVAKFQMREGKWRLVHTMATAHELGHSVGGLCDPGDAFCKPQPDPGNVMWQEPPGIEIPEDQAKVLRAYARALLRRQAEH